MSDNIKRLGNIYGRTGGSFSGNVYGINGIAPTITCVGGGGNRMPLILIVEDGDKDNLQPQP